MKQYAPLGDRRVLDWSVEAASSACDGVVVVVPAERIDEPIDGAVVAAGGPSRSASVRAGLERVPTDVEVIVVHDAARPLASAALFERVLGAVEVGADAAVPAVPVPDTLRARDGRAVDREQVLAVQTPQAFRADPLRAAHRHGGDATDDASLVEQHGGRVVVVEGDPYNRKITEPVDLDIAEALLARPFRG